MIYKGGFRFHFLEIQIFFRPCSRNIETFHLVQLSLLVAVETPSVYRVKGKLKKKFLKLNCLV